MVVVQHIYGTFELPDNTKLQVSRHSSYFVLGVDHGSIIAASLRLQISYPQLLHQHSTWWHCDLQTEQSRARLKVHDQMLWAAIFNIQILDCALCDESNVYEKITGVAAFFSPKIAAWSLVKLTTLGSVLFSSKGIRLLVKMYTPGS